MKIYLLIENKTNRVVNVYKYIDVALLNKDKGIKNAFRDIWDGPHANKHRIEVMEVIE